MNKSEIIEELSNIILQEKFDYEYVPWLETFIKSNNPKYDKYMGLTIEDFMHNDKITLMFLKNFTGDATRSTGYEEGEFYYEKGDCGRGDAAYFTKIPPIFSTYTPLTNVTIMYAGIKKIENLPPNLTSLNVYNNRITKIENLPSSVTNLDISYNKISKIENLPPALIIFKMVNTKISKIENIPSSVTDLDISCNKIAKIENLPPNIIHLRKEYVCDNPHQTWTIWEDDQ